MSTYFTCCCCKKKKKTNRRLKIPQKYCGQRVCQQARKREWDQQKRKTSSDYRQRRKLSQQRWRKTRPGDAYQKTYRQAHGQYEQDNRRRQIIRNHAFRRSKFELFSGLEQSHTAEGSKPGTSALFRIEPYRTPRDKKIVKTDALIVELTVHQGIGDVQQGEGQRL